MTENEARDFLGKFTLDRIVYASGKEVDTERFDYFTEVLRMAMIALTDIQQYRAIGTVDECRAARERQRVKKPIKDEYNHDCCPNCGWIVYQDEWGGRYLPHCENCGQAIDWSDTD